MAEEVYVIGVGRTDFQRNFSREGKSLRQIILESAAAAVADAGVEPGEIEAAVVGNFAAGLFTRQLHLGAILMELDENLRGIPTWHVEAACASGGVAVLNAAQQISGGIHQVVLVVGAEQQKTMSPAEGADVLGAAADFGAEKTKYGDFMFPKLFAQIAQVYLQRYGLGEEPLGLVAAKNRLHARRNPLAQMRDEPLTLQQARTESKENPRFAPPLKRSDCSPITDGGAAVLLCSGRMMRRLGRSAKARLLGWGHTTDYLPLERKDIPEFAIARRAGQQAYAMAGLTPQEIQGADVHDCFSISELIAYEILGWAGRGEGPKLLASGATALPWARKELGLGAAPALSIPINPGGGLIGDGHPVGATGVRQVVEAVQQLTRRAGQRQIEPLERYLTFNMGGSVTTSVAMIWGRV